MRYYLNEQTFFELQIGKRKNKAMVTMYVKISTFFLAAYILAESLQNEGKEFIYFLFQTGQGQAIPHTIWFKR